MKSKTDELVVYLTQTTDYKPKMAGLARLKYYTPELKEQVWNFPECSREGDTIEISTIGYDMLQLLPDFSQFLLIGKQIKGLRAEYLNCYFGGTDESPFLVEIHPQDIISTIEIPNKGTFNGWYEIWKAGVFYDVIKPKSIAQMEKIYGAAQTMRQGDIFAYPHPTTNWKDIMVNFILHPDLEIKDGTFDLFETRHQLHGSLLRTRYCTLGQGTVTAPDHKDLELGRICVLDQTEELAHRKQAD